MIAIVDYGMGNLRSVQKACEYWGQSVCVTEDKDTILHAGRVILPGVGAFAQAIERLDRTGLSDTIRTVAERQIPLLGICLGMQLFFEKSLEDGEYAGLGLMPGTVSRFPAVPGLKVPHMGWNNVTVRPGSRLLAGLPEQPYVYFVHSYRAEVREETCGICCYGGPFAAAVEKGSVWGTQFHPEKSGAVGLQILHHFLAGEGGKC